MPVLFPTLTPDPFLPSATDDKHQEQDIWFDALDYVDMDETWFDASDEAFGDQSEYNKKADMLVPFTEDCQRCVKQLIGILGDVKQTELIAACLSFMPGVPVSLVITVNTIYTAVLERKNIDLAILQSLGLASGYLLPNSNHLSALASFIRETVRGYTDETFVSQFLNDESNGSSGQICMLLAVVAVAAKYYLTDNAAPQRRILQVPAFMANLLIRIHSYWQALGTIAVPVSIKQKQGTHAVAPEPVAASEPSAAGEYAAAFEIDTNIKTVQKAGDTQIFITDFSSNSTVRESLFTRGTVLNKPGPSATENDDIPAKAHSLAVERLMRMNGIQNLEHSVTYRQQTTWRQEGQTVNYTHFNTKVGAVANPGNEPQQTAMSISLLSSDLTKLSTNIANTANAESAVNNTNSADLLTLLSEKEKKFVDIKEKTQPNNENSADISAPHHASHKKREGWGLLKDFASRINNYNPLSLTVASAMPLPNSQQALAKASLTAENDALLKKTNKHVIRALKKEAILDSKLKAVTISGELLTGVVADFLFNEIKMKPADRVQLIARAILSASNQYGSGLNETLSVPHSIVVVKNWFFENVLGSTFHLYFAERIAATERGSELTLGEFKDYCSIEELIATNKIDPTKIIKEGSWDNFEAMYTYFVSLEFPLFKLPDFGRDDIKAMKFSDYDFALLHAGALGIDSVKDISHFNSDEAFQFGAAILQQIRELDNADIPFLSCLNNAAILFFAQKNPAKFKESRLAREKTLQQESVKIFIEKWNESTIKLDTIVTNYNAFEGSLNQWKSKRELASHYIEKCPDDVIMKIPIVGYNYPKNRHDAKNNAIQSYLSGNRVVCPGIPRYLEPKYKELTSKVADNFKKFDDSLIDLSFSQLKQSEYDFISDPQSIIKPASIKMEATHKELRLTIKGMIVVPFKKEVKLSHCDLFSVNKNNEVRIYGVKKLDKGGYNVIRLDKEIENYIEHDVLDFSGVGDDFHIKNGRLQVSFIPQSNYGKNKITLDFDFEVVNEKVSFGEGDINAYRNWLSTKHRAAVYEPLYESGNNKSIYHKARDFATSLIPFVDCINYSRQGDKAAIITCFLDIISIISIGATATKIGAKFGMQLYGAGRKSTEYIMRSGFNKKAISNILKEFDITVKLPTLNDYTLLSKQAISVFDPGFGLLYSVGQSSTQGLKRIIALIKANGGSPSLISRLDELLPESKGSDIAQPAQYHTARLPHVNINVPVKNIGKVEGYDAYAIVNPQNGEASGYRYYLYNNDLHKLPEKSHVPDKYKKNVRDIKKVTEELKNDGCFISKSGGRNVRCVPSELLEKLKAMPLEILHEILSCLEIKELSVLANALGEQFESAAVDIINRRLRRNDNYQRDVLVQAVSNQDLDTIRFLQNSAIKPKIDFNAQDIDGNNILTHSVKKGALDSLRELLSLPGMNVNHKHRHDGSLLVIAAEMNNGKTVNYLLTHPDIDVNLSDDRGCTALHYAIVKKNNELAKKLLLNESCDINIKEDVLGVTAFMQAIFLNNNNIASEFLSRYDLNTYLKDYAGDDALDLAQQRGNVRIENEIAIVRDLHQKNDKAINFLIQHNRNPQQAWDFLQNYDLPSGDLVGSHSIARWIVDKQQIPSFIDDYKIATIRVINDIKVHIKTSGNENSQQLLFPEKDEIKLYQSEFDASAYEAGVAALSNEQREALRTWTALDEEHGLHYSDGTPEINDGINFELNQKLFDDRPLTAEEQITYDNMNAAMASGKIPTSRGDYIRESHYTSSMFNPWAAKAIKVGDIVTNSRAFMSVSSETDFVKSAVTDNGGISEPVESFIFYKFENADQPIPLLPLTLSVANAESEFLYCPNSLFRVTGISVSQAASLIGMKPDQVTLKRTGVTLSEVKKEELRQNTVVRNIFTGEGVNVFKKY